MQSVRLRINEATKSCEPIDAPTTPTTTQDGGLIEAVVVDSSAVALDMPITTVAIDLDTNETTPSNPMVRDLVLNLLVENISSDLRLEDVADLSNPTGPELVKLVEKKRKASMIDFASARFKFKTKKTTRSSSIPVEDDQDTLQEKAPDVIPEKSILTPMLLRVRN